MKDLLSRLQSDFPELKFEAGETFFWSPRNKTVSYSAGSTQPEVAKWSLLHEVSHGILGHQNYKSDYELMQLEVAAWLQAKVLAKKYGVAINPEHIQDCLDTYRDWLHLRATCPACNTVSTQKSPNTYECFNCGKVWHVSNSRFCRPYRMAK